MFNRTYINSYRYLVKIAVQDLKINALNYETTHIG